MAILAAVGDYGDLAVVGDYGDFGGGRGLDFGGGRELWRFGRRWGAMAIC